MGDSRGRQRRRRNDTCQRHDVLVVFHHGHVINVHTRVVSVQ